MQKIFEKVYFITKLSSSILLLIILAVLVYIFSRAYLDQYNLANDNYVDQISHINKEIESKFEKNNNSISIILEKIEKIEDEVKLLEEIKNNNNINLKEDLEKLSEDLDFIKKGSEQDFIKSKDKILFEEKVFIINEYVENILLNIEDGKEFSDIIIKIQGIITNDSLNHNLKKLSLFSNGSLLSYSELKNNFNQNSDILLRKYLIDNSKNSLLTKFVLKFFNLRIDSKYNSNDPLIKKLSIAKNYLYEKDIENSVKEISTLSYKNNYFKKWIEDAKKYEKSIKLINLIKKDLGSL